MLKNVRMYPNVSVKKENYSNVKKVVMPNQSMSLQDIIKRFIRRESLPLEKQAVYEDRMGDLEKIAHEDISVKADMAADLKEKLSKKEKEMKEKEQKEKKEKQEKYDQDVIAKHEAKKASSKPEAKPSADGQ